MNTTDMPPPTVERRPGDPDTGSGDAKAAVRREVDDARERLSGAASDIRAEASQAGATISGMVSDQAERRKDEAADGLRTFSSAVRRAADDLGERDASMAARVAREAALGLERLSDGLQARSIADMSRSIGEFGRQNPAAFLTGCLLAGVAIGRVVIASGGRGGAEDWRYGRDDDDWREDDWREDAGYAPARAYADRSEFGAGQESFSAAPGDPLRPRSAVAPSAAARPDPMPSAHAGPGAGPGTGGRDGEL